MQIAVIGGGAAGFFAAIRAAETNPEARVFILEKGKDVLAKVKISGGGRCNVTHACFEPRELVKFYPRGQRELLGPFHRFACGDTMNWFDERGVSLKIEDDGRVFPVSNQSQSIIDCLWQAARDAGIEVLTHHGVDDLHPPDDEQGQWRIQLKEEIRLADRLIVTTGSSPAFWAVLRRLGHTLVEPVPSLFTFHVDDPRIKTLPGLVAPQGIVHLPGSKLSQQGPLLITHWGFSGPAALKLSAWGARFLAEKHYDAPLEISWCGCNYNEALEILQTCKQRQAAKPVLAQCPWDLPKRLWHSLAQSVGVLEHTRWADLSKAALQNLAKELAAGSYSMRGKSTFKEEFVTAGGIALPEIDFKTFASRKLPNLYFAGEVLDIDAVTGGFNFQAAWTGGYIAGEAAAMG